MFATVSFAQEATETEENKKPVITGSLDMYSKFAYKTGFTSFTKSQGSLDLGMASIKAEHQIGKVGAVIDLGFGQRAEEFAFNEKNTGLAIKQAYLTYEVIDKLVLTGGTFATHIGYEVVDAYMNKNYSMSYGFSFGPFYNTGLKANYQITDEIGAMVGIMLPTDTRTVAQTGSTQKGIVGQVSYAKDDTSLFLNFSSQSTNPNFQNTTQIDLVGNHKINEEIDLGLNITYQSKSFDAAKFFPKQYTSASWYSAALYVGYNVKDNMSLNYRLEKYGSSKANNIPRTIDAFGVHVLSNTLSLNYKVGNLTIIPELRADVANFGIFNNTSKLNALGLIAATYTF